MWLAVMQRLVEQKKVLTFKKEFTGFSISAHQHDCQLIVLEHQYGCRDVMSKLSITLGLDVMRFHCMLPKSVSLSIVSRLLFLSLLVTIL